jgi:uncharacterized membrane protein YqjE
MAVEDNQPPGIAILIGKLVRTSIGALQNRFELLALECQQERAYVAELLIWVVALLFLGMMGAILLTGTIIYLCPEEIRIYVAGGFTLLYFFGALYAWFAVKGLLEREPFPDTLEQAKRDRAWLKSFN